MRELSKGDRKMSRTTQDNRDELIQPDTIDRVTIERDMLHRMLNTFANIEVIFKDRSYLEDDVYLELDYSGLDITGKCTYNIKLERETQDGELSGYKKVDVGEDQAYAILRETLSKWMDSSRYALYYKIYPDEHFDHKLIIRVQAKAWRDK